METQQQTLKELVREQANFDFTKDEIRENFLKKGYSIEEIDYALRDVRSSSNAKGRSIYIGIIVIFYAFFRLAKYLMSSSVIHLVVFIVLYFVGIYLIGRRK